MRVNNGESIQGVCGVAAPVLGADHAVIAALAVQGPEIRLPAERILQLGPEVAETAQAIASTIPSGPRL